MKINTKVLSVPPYISTSWKNIASLHIEDLSHDLILVVTLHSGARIEIPSLSPPMLEAIFATHAKVMEQEAKTPPAGIQPMPPGMENLGTFLEHNPEQANAPDLPADLIERIKDLTRSLDQFTLEAKPEPHCNCLHCQLTRSMLQAREEREELSAEEVTDADLTFRDWDIVQTKDQLFTVTNPLEPGEQYTVFLGDPVGCTCGEKHCEHIQAVLKS
ncbi:MAG: hypothetical protein JSS61_00830 [Verrucomicrobia bacterium]|nr:hypothetical protein [Verrucomicrobiota bacterium]